MPQAEAESSKAHIISVEPGHDTETIMAAAEAIANPVSPCEIGRDPDKVGASGAQDMTNTRIGGLGPSREQNLPSAGRHSKGSASTKPQRESVVREAEDSDYLSDSATETVVADNWTGMLQRAIKAAVNSRLQTQQELEKKDCTIDKLKKSNRKKRCEIEELKDTISMLRKHSNQVEERYKNAETLLREANASTADLRSDIARLSNALPEFTKDDQYFKTKFSGIFYSLENWVLQYFMHSKIDSSNILLLPTELRVGLSEIWGEGWKAFALEETLHTIEAVAILVIQSMIFDTRILGILGDSLPKIEEYFGSCSVDEINNWRMQTTRMIVEDKGFPARLKQRVCEVVEHIDKLLGPLGDDTLRRAVKRMRGLKAIVEEAAELALECNKEPATFHFRTYTLGSQCQAKYMTDAHRTVDDEGLGDDGACVKFTVSPAVLRVPTSNANDEPIIIMKARVVRHLQGPSRGSQTRDDIESITGPQLDQAFGSSENQV
ncbi:hypothetical protein L211DRAFT_847948 [Terfezia boudieri ATCC MYA-4762]|uniref:Uncharacterized protein n=1 Tax=Terfezia boudieri ATCC MYA-4762 TaxID=1051890 RepID=A0A3N4LRN8_9PEZI|nr:hypothetical protein L211DRAFT_847948 [Terfezia boudieri ATCC MYA-4762]